MGSAKAEQRDERASFRLSQKRLNPRVTTGSSRNQQISVFCVLVGTRESDLKPGQVVVQCAAD
eukprot:CAMPEP_0184491514 /NCGR_PEP_ID=MMETSP0113_2-20130426/20592_1 /TAXON_ID=91329 /ORGANISM="Norrisiella sphaerica, Strain BC52" /LENGTH=62 /DNA_ID=CAMNT_0026875917 /DNA_START=104 /DNA_END=289 /DNA_ORIENTATION=+